MKRSVWFWVLAVVLTVVSVLWQRASGPSYPVRFHEDLPGLIVSGKLLRTQNTDQTLPVRVRVSPRDGQSGAAADLTAVVLWRRFPTADPWQTVPMQRDGEQLTAELPPQPPAGKIEYAVRFEQGGQTVQIPSVTGAVARFKGAVPFAVLAVHVFVMFFGMLWSTRAGLEALFGGDALGRHALIALVLLVIGGLFFGPIVQKYAFGVYWSGWPLGEDLTDNKLAVAILAWTLAYWRIRAGRPDPAAGRGWAVAAMLVVFVIFSIPHSLHGSTLDYETMEQIQR